MSENHPNNPLQDLTLEHILVKLEEHHGWPGLSDKVKINCFKKDPSIKSSLKFLRKTPWARKEVEALYLDTFTERSPWHKSIKRVAQ